MFAVLCLLGLIVSVLPMGRVKGLAALVLFFVFVLPLASLAAGAGAYEGYLLERDGRTVRAEVVGTYTVQGRNRSVGYLKLADAHGRAVPGSAMPSRGVGAERGDSISHTRAARIAGEEGLRAEVFGNEGRRWFAETVVEDVIPE
ncbi:hypothetical protein AB0C96_37665 [Streptomyces sp. NPDC048506]|uniref:hypothetical protein n=1 Tax=Streptomyces sp. NPDC048506 TaxID=3155028 RepID=UPI003445802C